MTKRASILAILAVGSTMVLAGCGEDEAADSQAEPPPVTVEPEDGGNDAAQSLDEAQDSASDALSQLRDSAADVLGNAREAAEQALDDAQPALERAGEIAGEIGQSVSEIAERAREDLEEAAQALEERVAEATDGEVSTPAGEPDALLGPEEELSADTRAAARAAMAGVGPDFVGAWAATAEDCAEIDRQSPEIFAVITPTTIRRYESVCNIESTETTDTQTIVQASCIAEGTTEEREIVFDTSEDGRLRIVRGADDEGVELVACSLP